ncbi:hypothetical protein CLOM_g7718 [Closterium sp. NIES-68]|nr:hypothetical protein CLOM_g7718 [Closterium sp. NIES-68]
MPPRRDVAVAAAGAAAVAAGGAAGGQPQQQQQQQHNPIMSMIRMAMFWYMISNFFFKKPPKDPAMLSRNLFRKGEDLDMWVYLTEAEKFSNFQDESALVWTESGIPYTMYDGPAARRTLDFTYYPSKAVTEGNGTVFAHVFFAKSGFSPDPTDQLYDQSSTFSKTHPLVAYYPRPKVDTRKRLLGGGSDANDTAGEPPPPSPKAEAGSEKGDAPAIPEEVEWIGFWKPNLTISLIDDFTAYPRTAIPEIFHKHMTFDPQTGNYFPTLYMNEFWLLRDKLTQLNGTVSEVPLSMVVETLPAWRWHIYLSMDQSFKLQQQFGTAVESEADELKRVFLEGNPILLGVTVVVSILHSVFDFFAFKNDIQFWNQNKSMEGLSARSVVINFVCQLIIFLYLLDNHTSWLILISAAISCGIEFWKIGKAMHVEIDGSGRIPWLRFRDRDSYARNKTKEYDALAMRYFSYVLYPLVAGYAIYSLVYETHKSWYSWVLNSLTGCVYTFGFIMMCPQLFINYKLKSVAHLPWRQMTYKFLNTIVDDLFAFVIKMPTLHRLSVFRDDIIFLIFLYQRWIYPVDKKRVNEFGFGGEPEGVAGAAAGSSVTADGTETDRLTAAEAEVAAAAAAAGAAEGSEGRAGEEGATGAAGGDGGGAAVRGVSEEGLVRRGKGKEKGKGGKGGGEGEESAEENDKLKEK